MSASLATGNPKVTIGRALTRARAVLEATSESPRLDAEILLAQTLGWSRPRLLAHPEASIDPGCARRFGALVKRRCDGEPVAYLTGRREFWSLESRSHSRTPSFHVPRPSIWSKRSSASSPPIRPRPSPTSAPEPERSPSRSRSNAPEPSFSARTVPGLRWGWQGRTPPGWTPGTPRSSPPTPVPRSRRGGGRSSCPILPTSRKETRASRRGTCGSNRGMRSPRDRWGWTCSRRWRGRRRRAWHPGDGSCWSTAASKARRSGLSCSAPDSGRSRRFETSPETNA